MRVIGLAVAAGLSISSPGICQTTDPSDFRLGVAYCLGTRTRVIEQFERDQRRDCVASALPTMCDFDKRSIAAVQSEAARLRLYLVSKLEEGQGGVADVIATQRGAQDASAIFGEITACNGVKDLVACAASLEKNNPTLAATSGRFRRCAQIIQMLPF